MNKIEYPDGQINIQIEDFNPIIKMRINSYNDLFELKSICDVYKQNNKQLEQLIIPCLFGQRSDRRFQSNESFGLKIICDFINSMNFNKVSILDTHSDVSLALINNSEKIEPSEFIAKTIIDIIPNNLVLISPDAGAYKKVFKYAESYMLPLVAANKFRDLNGKITLNILGNVKDKDCLIIDDICDGGYTFIKLAEKLKEQGANKIFLYVSHGYFNKGFEELSKNITKIYCTNSIKNINNPIIKQYNII